MTPQESDIIQSGISYGCGLAAICLSEMADHAQDWALILGCAVVIVRLIHDTVALYRYIKHLPNRNSDK